eukprot:Hpha_TRINITY_DN10580_c0_g2::TRINITY_DN10580_c0_g2_i1::g.31430::m.31430
MAAALLLTLAFAASPPSPPQSRQSEPHPLHKGAAEALGQHLFGGDVEHAASLPWEEVATLWRANDRGRHEPPRWQRDEDGEPFLTESDLWNVVKTAIAVHTDSKSPDPLLGSGVELVRALRPEEQHAEPKKGRKGQKRRSAPEVWTEEPLRGNSFSGVNELRAETTRKSASVVVRQLEQRYQPVHEICRGLTEALGCPCEASAWYTPPAAAAKGVHSSMLELFVMQVSGRKTWTLGGDGKCSRPRPDQVGSDVMEVEGSVKYELGPGDVLYIPRGVPRRADTLQHDSASLHVSVGMRCGGGRFTMEELLHNALSEYASRTQEIESSSPQGFEPPTPSEDLKWDVAWRAPMHLLIRVLSERYPALRAGVQGLAGSSRDWELLEQRLEAVKGVLRDGLVSISPDEVMECPVNDTRLVAWTMAGTRPLNALGTSRAVQSGSEEVSALLTSMRTYLSDIAAHLWAPPPGSGGLASAFAADAASRRKIPMAADRFQYLWQGFVDNFDHKKAMERMVVVRQRILNQDLQHATGMLQMHQERMHGED